MGVHEFCNDDDGYVAWLNKHPGGYVMNIHKSESLADAHLHDATCSALVAQIDRGVSLTDPYKKICGDTLVEIEQWSTDRLSGPVPPCKHCRDVGPQDPGAAAARLCQNCFVELPVTRKCHHCDQG